jgi:hypothetical protein
MNPAHPACLPSTGDDGGQTQADQHRERESMVMQERYTVQLQGWDSDQWEDVLYTDDYDRASRFVARMQGNPKVRGGRVVDTKAETQRQEVHDDKESGTVCAGEQG